MDKNDEYSSYMLRFRRMHKNDQPTWVVFVHSIQTGQDVCFPGLDGLIDFLQTRFCESIEPEAANLHLEHGTEEAEPESAGQPSEG